MWALRRASIHLKNQGLRSGATRASCLNSDIPRCCLESYNFGIIEPQGIVFDELVSSARFYNSSSSFSNPSMEMRSFSSQADSKNSGEEDDDLKDALSEHEAPHDAASKDENDNESVSESELSENDNVDDDIENELETLDTEIDVKKEKSPKAKATSGMTKAILAAPALPVSKVLDKWVEDGNEVTRTDVSLTMLHLRKGRRYVKALQLSEWLESTKSLEFLESNYASRVDLIAKVRGIFKAEQYIQQIPESFRGEIAYRTLLANCVSATNIKKSEEVFNKMRNLGYPLTCFSCNQLLILYKRTNKKKIADILLLMEKENIKPTLFTYQILIDVKGQSNDVNGMEKILETMKNEGLEPSSQILTTLARHYAKLGHKDKAESVLKDLVGEDLKNSRWVFRFILPIYASLGREDEVDRLWNVCEPHPRLAECLAAIESYGQLKNIEKAEAAFEKMVKILKRPSSKHFAALLNVYADNKMLQKGKDLVKRMADSGGNMVGPMTWDALVKLYVKAGEVEKADSILEKAVKQKKAKPLFDSYFTILDQYAKRGDIHNAEKIFLNMKQCGYVSRLKPYHTLLHAYIVAKKPAYGFNERIKADNIFPNNALASQLAQVDAFKKSAVADLLD